MFQMIKIYLINMPRRKCKKLLVYITVFLGFTLIVLKTWMDYVQLTEIEVPNNDDPSYVHKLSRKNVPLESQQIIEDFDHIEPLDHKSATKECAPEQNNTSVANEAILFALLIGGIIEAALFLLAGAGKTSFGREDSYEKHLNESEIGRIKDEIKLLNEDQYIYNQDLYGPLSSNDTVIVIQVHDHLENLQYLVESLTNAEYINTSLVIFSHDIWDENINNFVRSISAFKVRQIFYPYTRQLFPFQYPGTDPRDCIRNHMSLNRELPDEEKIECLNSKWPDSFGYYREAFLTQTKHHWWWKLIQVFSKTQELRGFDGQVLFLEENHYVAPDILHMLKLLVKDRDKYYKGYHILTLGSYQIGSSKEADLIEKRDWIGQPGFALDRTIYEVIIDYAEDFCNYDDYNWDITLGFLAATCAKDKLPTLIVKYSRIHHVRTCGMHYQKTDCNITEEVSKVKELIFMASDRLFPKSIYVQKYYTKASIPKLSGGWADYRDKTLCVIFLNETSHIELKLEELQFQNISNEKMTF